ncbi:hypothetical protein D3C71_1288950 [compost metagenome]
MSRMPAMPCTTVTKMIGPIIIRISLMNASPKGFIAEPMSGCSHPNSTPITVPASTWNQSWPTMPKRLGRFSTTVISTLPGHKNKDVVRIQSNSTPSKSFRAVRSTAARVTCPAASRSSTAAVLPLGCSISSV